MKTGRTQEESSKQMNKGRSAPPYTGERNHLTKTNHSNNKLKTHLGMFAFVRTQMVGLAFWCMLGAHLGQFAVKFLVDLFILLNCPRLRHDCNVRAGFEKPSLYFTQLVHVHHPMSFHPAHPTVPTCSYLTVMTVTVLLALMTVRSMTA